MWRTRCWTARDKGFLNNVIRTSKIHGIFSLATAVPSPCVDTRWNVLPIASVYLLWDGTAGETMEQIDTNFGDDNSIEGQDIKARMRIATPSGRYQDLLFHATLKIRNRIEHRIDYHTSSQEALCRKTTSTAEYLSKIIVSETHVL